MSRGIMYHITTDETSVGSMCSWEFGEHLESLQAEYVMDQVKPDAMASVARLVDELSKAGFEIVPCRTECDEEPAAILRTGDEENLVRCQCAFFGPMLEALRAKVAEIELREFATQPASLYEMARNIDDGYGDAVYLDTGGGPATYTLHGFVRRLQPEKDYFISPNTVLMH